MTDTVKAPAADGRETTTMLDETRYEVVIGLEVHAQLLTRSKMFCGCSAEYAGAPPNTHVCPICLGMPGTLPVINKRAVEATIMTGLALQSAIPEASKFDRKNYPYPDLPKGYQISQYDMPFCKGGVVEVEADGQVRRVGMNRVHLEEDTARLTHGPGGSLLDFNRSGAPLMEIVSEPDLRSPAEARAYLQKLRSILRTLGVSTGNMEEGSFRCDANCSLRPVGAVEYGAKVEVKNMNSFRSVQRAIEFEIQRQTQILREGGQIAQETRGWVEERGVTVSQRSKEQAHDYRYFPEPDLPPIFVSREWVSDLASRLPELPDAKRGRFAREYGLSEYDAAQLAADSATSRFFERALALGSNPKTVANWMQSELFRLLNDSNQTLEQSKATPEHLVEALALVEQSTISGSLARPVFEQSFRSGTSPKAIVAERGLAQVSGESELDPLIAVALAANPAAVADYRAGKASAINFLKGQVMKATRGQANPSVVEKLLRARLEAEGSPD